MDAIGNSISGTSLKYYFLYRLNVSPKGGRTMLDLLAGTIRTATPILLAALGGLICERVGVFNIALEGLMLFGAFFGIWGVWLVGSPWAGAGIAIVLTSILAFIFAVLVVKFHSDPTITALGINMLAEGVTTFWFLVTRVPFTPPKLSVFLKSIFH